MEGPPYPNTLKWGNCAWGRSHKYVVIGYKTYAITHIKMYEIFSKVCTKICVHHESTLPELNLSKTTLERLFVQYSTRPLSNHLPPPLPNELSFLIP